MSAPQSLTEADLPERIAASIVSEFSPERVVLFGSRAWGEPDSASDVDLLVVLETEDALAIEGAIARRCRPRFVPMDVLVRTPSELAERLRIGDPFMKRVVTQGRVLYQRPARSLRSDAEVLLPRIATQHQPPPPAGACVQQLSVRP